MRLKTIKLAGFKSFVDPTTVPFPTNMSAIVGPNGCGKSNIIDAVRWVMGESSAKHLRGESMTDVIFNGSSSRKPVGQASIELVFDNSLGKAPGEYAQYAEISVRRRVSRDGQSEYFLNGTKCRRKDITDLFMGTGLGPRSYAIIEQGMISRLIEAKPEELRIYIEEAAGISRYKERRKETESRIRRTQENLERVNDLREELERQLQHLHRQAQAAERYKVLKQEERTRRAELAALRWQTLDMTLQAGRERITDTELELERLVTGRVGLDTDLERLRDQHLERTDQFNTAQARYYEAGADIARVEQSLEHLRDRARQTRLDLEQTTQAQRELQRELEQDQARLAEMEETLAELEPTLEEQTYRAEASSEALANAESGMHDWQVRWDTFSQASADARQRAEIEQSRIRAGEDVIRRLQEREQRLREERDILAGQLDDESRVALREQLVEAELHRDELLARMQAGQDDIGQVRARILTLDADVARCREESHTAKGQLASLRALQDEAMGDGQQELADWLSGQQWTGLPRLAQRLRVTPGWERAVETVLGTVTQALCLESADMPASLASARAPGGVVLVAAAPASAARAGLLAQVSGAEGVEDMLATVEPVEDLSIALERRSGLREGQSFVTRDGTWIGRHWVRFPAGQAGQPGVLERQRLIETLEARLITLQQDLDVAQAALAAQREQLQRLEQQREQDRQHAADAERQVSAVRAQLSALDARAEQIGARLTRLRDDIAEQAEQRAQEDESLAEARLNWDTAMRAMAVNADERERLLLERDQLREHLDGLRVQARHDRDHVHQAQLQVQAARHQRENLVQACARLQVQRERLDERVELLKENMELSEEPQHELEDRLAGLLERRLHEEGKLAGARDALEEIDRQVRGIEQSRSRTEQSIQSVRSALEQYRMESQALEIRCGTYLEQLQELGEGLRDVLARLPEDASDTQWEAELEALAGRIQRLGAINLAAIDEYRVQAERKTYLDTQHADLTEALETLENAIRKIDRETRARFKETFDQVNQGLQALFPKVFGGGTAYLELTGEDLLETGVAIMARPPGKKNSTIHLLSGGEKALTAIALVFSIFQLNPAPFCMLDEVDAPLDDANVGRYARLVKEMSAHLQFIYISHNKIAMEQADQLMGVTMHEPGVSRLVSVNVEEAAALAAV